MHLATADHLDFKPHRHRVDALGTDAVGAAGKFVAALPILAAGVQRGQHHLDAGQPILRMNVHGNSPAVVPGGDRAINMNGHLDAVAISRQMFVHGVVEHLGDAMMQRPLVGAADVHAGLLADRFKAFQLAQL